MNKKPENHAKHTHTVETESHPSSLHASAKARERVRSRMKPHHTAQRSPIKPAAARGSTTLSRRSFLGLSVGALSALALVETGVGSFLFLRARAAEARYGGKVVAGSLDDFPPGSVTEFPSEGFYLVNTRDEEMMAIYRRCPHLGCTVDWNAEDERFYCPCHGSSFDVTGQDQSPPVPRSLDVFSLEIDHNEKVVVDTTRILRNEEFNPRTMAKHQ